MRRRQGAPLASEHRWGYLLVAPIVLFLACFLVVPIAQVFYYSFTSWDGASLAAEWIGFDNYAGLLASKEFWTVLRNNLYFLVVGVPVWTLFPLLVAVLLHEEVRGWKFFKSAYFFPSVLSTVVVGVLFKALLKYNGPLNEILRGVGLDALAIDWLAQGATSIPAIILIINWAGFGAATLIYLAGLSTVPSEVYESAVLDGAGWFQRLRSVTMPMILPVIQLNIVLNVIYAFTSLFNYIFVMTSGGPGYESTVIEYLLYQKAFRSGESGAASALAVIMFVIVLAVSRVQLRLFAGGKEE